MILKRNKNRKILITLGTFFLCLFSVTFSTQSVSAEYTTGVTNYSQGATLTEKYYVYTTCGIGCSTFSIHRCDRPSFTNCETLSSFAKKPSSMYHKWGTNFAQVITYENGSMYCFQLDPFKQVANKKCGKMVKSDGLNFSGDINTLRQGWTKYGKCSLRGYGNNEPPGNSINYILLFNSKNKKIDQWTLPQHNGEIEDVMADGTGQIWYTYLLSTVSLTYYKMDKATSDKWAQKCKPTSSDSSSSSSSSSPTKRTSTKSAAKKKDANSEGSNYIPSVSTYDGVVNTTFFGTIQDDGEGCGVYTVLDLVMTILTIGIGVTALIGITISGITYLTAKDNVEKTTKAKRRIYEIVIGLAAYAVIWGFLTFLLPEFNPELKACKTLTAEEITARDAEIAAKKAAKTKETAQTTKNKNSSSATDAATSEDIQGADLAGATATGKKVLQAADWSAHYMNDHKFIYFQYDPSNGYGSKYIKPGYGPKGGVYPDIWPHNWEQAKAWRMTHCSGFAALVLKKTDLFKGLPVKVFSQNGRMTSYFWNNEKAEKTFKKYFVKRNGKGETLSNLVNQNKLGPGDIFGKPSGTHTMIYAGKVNGKHYIYEVSAPNNHVLTYGLGKKDRYKGYLHPVISGNTRVKEFFHAK